MKRLAIILLVCVNVALLALVLGKTLPRAEAQTMHGASNYLLMTGKLDQDEEILYIIDVAQRRLGAMKWNRTQGRLVTYGARDLTRDFRGARGR